MNRSIAGLAMVCLGLVSDGCSGGDAGSSKPGDIPLLTGTVDLSIGSMEGDDASVFGRVAGLALAEDGRIVVADGQADELRVFSPDGTFLYRTGRHGGGPGDLAGPCCIVFGPEGNLWVRDGGNARYDIFALDADSARYLRSIHMSHSDVNRWAPVTFDSAGHVIDIGYRPDLAGGELRPARMHLDSAGTVLSTEVVHDAPKDSIGMREVEFNTPQGKGVLYFYPPYGPSGLNAYAPNGEFAYAFSGAYAVAWYDEAGHELRRLTRSIAHGPPLTAEERAAADSIITAEAQRAGQPRRAFGFDIPDYHPPLRNLLFDADGRLWVQLTTAEGEPNRADVYSAGGTLDHTAEWPRAVRLAWGVIRGDVALGVASDSLGVQRVVRLRFR